MPAALAVGAVKVAVNVLVGRLVGVALASGGWVGVAVSRWEEQQQARCRQQFDEISPCHSVGNIFCLHCLLSFVTTLAALLLTRGTDGQTEEPVRGGLDGEVVLD